MPRAKASHGRVAGEAKRILTIPPELLYAGTIEANLLARTRLNAPISLGFAPRVETIILADGKPRQMLFSSTALLSS
jgi:hypothetical protein